MIQTKLFSDLYLTKLLNSLAKPVFLVYALKKSSSHYHVINYGSDLIKCLSGFYINCSNVCGRDCRLNDSFLRTHWVNGSAKNLVIAKLLRDTLRSMHLFIWFVEACNCTIRVNMPIKEGRANTFHEYFVITHICTFLFTYVLYNWLFTECIINYINYFIISIFLIVCFKWL